MASTTQLGKAVVERHAEREESSIERSPTGATTGPIQVIAGGSNSNAVNFTVLAQSPTITGLSETMGHVGDTITITGKNLDTNGTISFNGVAGSPSSWDDTSVVAAVPTGAQTGPVTVMVNGQTSNGITLTVIPVPNLTGISPNTGDVGTSVTISGTGFGPSESYNAVVFNGLAVQASTWTNTQVTVTVPRGATSGPLAVRIGPTISNSHNFTIVPTGSQAVSIIPGSATLVVGQTLTLRLSDDLEHNITGASWSLNDNTLAELSQDDPPLLTANAAGTVTVTATSQNLNATAQVTILDGANPIPLGTVQWSLPPSTSAYSVQKIMQTVPSDGITPDLLILEDDNQGGIWLRGLYADGQQKWYTRIGSSGNAPDRVVDSIPDGEGGSISLVNSMTTYWANADALVRTNGTTGAPLWRHSSPGGLENLAVNQDGDILLVETIMADDHHWYSSVVKIDHATGNKLASWQLPSTFYFHSEGPGDQPVYWPPSVGPLAISPEGSILLEAGTYNFVGWYDHVTEQHGESEVDTLQLVTIPSGGGAEIRILDTCTGLNCHLGQGPVIPDGEGGAIMTWSTGTGDTFRVNVTHNGTAALPAEMGTVTGLVLGESAYFVTDGSHVVAIDKTSDTQTWSWSPAEGSVEVLAATADGGVAVRNTGTSQGENVVRLNASGNPTYDTWGTNGSGYGVLSNAIYFDKGLWVGQVGNPVVGGLLGSDLYAALSSWAFSKGTKQEPAAADPALKLVGLADCTEKSPAGGGQFNYQRFPKYKLVDKNEQSPAENYTVFEKLDPHKEFTTCQKDGKNTGMSPCDYADGNTIPYREFDDEIRLGLSNAGPNGVHNNQSFVYGLPGKRLWEVKRIERYGLKVDNSGYGRIAVEHVSYLDLWFRNFSEPLIDGMAAPWMGPCNDNYPWIPLH